ncbi:SDR family NAD(P)-dependent oxidoreductase [Rhodoferax sp. TBRC 17198]|uniref:SDR family NAD(P)-dependent oxidoreductase n=1 Tax=Rhodoferax potami TaxID=3068338 RepID=UPI0028BEC3C7|nr:SDR family NAD(P)-dependent oxidoreductase [Rhodoferax sp. TBRC 17198]MDT7521971.1 SDR family NAD(P)-dependent oxidoreductase [Rhodoferax sp. TBRC 17198]
MDIKKKIVIVGATSAIAEHCARLWISPHPSHLILIGRDAARVNRVAADLKVRSPRSDIQVIETEFLSSEAIDTTVNSLFKSGVVDIALIAHGSLPDQVECQANLHLCQDALCINGVSPALYAEAFAKEMEKVNHGTIAIIGSVAGDRGRRSNYVYGAAKGLVNRYAQGLNHRFSGTNVKVVFIKPGPTDTPMTAHLKSTGAKLAPVETVARQIVDGIDSAKPVIYAPRKWWTIMMIIRHLPTFIFNKINI